ncbi:Lrp/AsnC family transcriptional regulator [Halobacteriaceae archaeon GCM10025711]
MEYDLDDVDRGILHLLQKEARHTTAQEIAEQVGVSASTIRNRIDNLEAIGVIRGYHPEIDYEAAGLPLRTVFVVTADPMVRGEAVERVLDIKGVVDVREMLTGRRNIHIDVVGTSTSDMVRISDAIHSIGLEIESSEILRQTRVQPFDHFVYADEE